MLVVLLVLAVFTSGSLARQNIKVHNILNHEDLHEVKAGENTFATLYFGFNEGTGGVDYGQELGVWYGLKTLLQNGFAPNNIFVFMDWSSSPTEPTSPHSVLPEVDGGVGHTLPYGPEVASVAYWNAMKEVIFVRDNLIDPDGKTGPWFFIGGHNKPALTCILHADLECLTNLKTAQKDDFFGYSKVLPETGEKTLVSYFVGHGTLEDQVEEERDQGLQTASAGGRIGQVFFRDVYLAEKAKFASALILFDSCHSANWFMKLKEGVDDFSKESAKENFEENPAFAEKKITAITSAPNYSYGDGETLLNIDITPKVYYNAFSLTPMTALLEENERVHKTSSIQKMINSRRQVKAKVNAGVNAGACAVGASCTTRGDLCCVTAELDALTTTAGVCKVRCLDEEKEDAARMGPAVEPIKVTSVGLRVMGTVYNSILWETLMQVNPYLSTYKELYNRLVAKSEARQKAFQVLKVKKNLVPFTFMGYGKTQADEATTEEKKPFLISKDLATDSAANVAKRFTGRLEGCQKLYDIMGKTAGLIPKWRALAIALKGSAPKYSAIKTLDPNPCASLDAVFTGDNAASIINKPYDCQWIAADILYYGMQRCYVSKYTKWGDVPESVDAVDLPDDCKTNAICGVLGFA